MSNKLNMLLNRGNFELIDEEFIGEGLVSLQKVGKVQRKYNKLDTDTFINEVRDSITANLLGFTHINTEKHGFDARQGDNESNYKYLEVKSPSFSSGSIGATFNDTTMEKALSFQQENVSLAISIWNEAADLLCIIYGSNKKIGDYLEEKVESFLGNDGTVRSTQTLGGGRLIKDYGFIAYSVSVTPSELYLLLKTKTGFSQIKQEQIKHIDELKKQ